MATTSNALLKFIDERDAENRSRLQLFLQQYGREGHAYLYFAAHAAVPALLTADMLYKIRLNFSRDEKGQSLNIPYLAISDLLQSSLCKPVSHRIFALYAPIRRGLRQWLMERPELGEARRKSLAQFALHYLEACPDEIRLPGLREALRWDAQTITDTAYAGQLLLERVRDSLRRQAPSFELQKMVEAAAENLEGIAHTAQADQGMSRMAFAVNLYRGSQAYQSGQIEEAIEYFDKIYPQLKKEGGAEAFRIPIPEEILRRYKLLPEQPKEEGPEDAFSYAFSLYVALDEGVTAAEAAAWLGVKPEQADGALPWGERLAGLNIGGDNRTAKFNVFFIHFTDTPRILDHLLFSGQGIYLLAVRAEKPEDLKAHVDRLVWRIAQSAGPAPFHLCRVGGNWGGSFERLKGALRSQYPQLGAIVSDGEEVFFPVAGQIDEASVETGRYSSRAWETWQECRPEAGALQAVKAIDDRMQLAGGVFLEADLLQKLAAAGEIFLASETAGEPLLAANKPLFLNRLLKGFARLVEKAPAGSCSPEEFISALKAGRPPEQAENLISVLEHYGLAFRKAEPQPAVIIPHLLPEEAPEFGARLYEAAYRRSLLNFNHKPPTLFNRFTALLGSSGAGLRSCTRLGLLWETERETVRMLEHPGFSWEVVQVRKEGKSDYDKLERLYALLDQALAGYHGISYTPAPPLHIPPHATPDMVEIAGGTFDMGDVMGDNEFDREKPVHKVRLSGFSLGRYAVTFEEYDAFCDATGREKPEDAGWGRGRRPAIYVDWYDAVEYCNWLSGIWGLEPVYKVEKDKKDPNNQNSSDNKKWLVTSDWAANGYRLPTEAEWEYAARAVISPSGRGQGGGKVRFGNGKDIADPKEINFDGSSSYKKPYSVAGEYRQKTVPVGSLNSPNALDLHDMSGNVYEWCWDWFAGDYYRSSPEDNPRGPGSGSRRVARGGYWGSYPRYCRAAYRNDWYPAGRGNVGFRLARSLEAGPSGPSYEPPVK